MLTAVVGLPSCARSTSSSSVDRPASKPGGVAAVPATNHACDETSVASLGKALAAAPNDGQLRLVAEQLPDACELPDAIAALLTAADNVDEAALAARVAVDPKIFAAALNEVCPGSEAVMRQAARARAKDRAGIQFDGCNFARFNLTARTDFVRLDANAAIAVYAHQWLREQGFTQAQVKPISGALLLAARPHWGSPRPGQTLPKVASALGPVPDAPTLHVTKEGLFFNGDEVLRLDDAMRPDPSALQGMLVRPLHEVLADASDQVLLAYDWSSGGRPDARLVVVADASVPFGTMLLILHTAARARFEDYALVANSERRERGTVPLQSSTVGGQARVRLFPEFGVALSDAGYGILVTGIAGKSKSENIARADGAPWDIAALTARAAQHHTEHTASTRAYVDPSDTVAWGVFVQTVAALRGEGCDHEPSSCVLPNVTVGFIGTRSTSAKRAKSKKRSRRDRALSKSAYGGAFAVGNEDEDVWAGLEGEDDEPFGKGGLGLVGTGRGGSTIGVDKAAKVRPKGKGSGYGRGTFRRSKAAKVPRVLQARATIEGQLDESIVRRVVRSHINEIRHCYRTRLVRDPTLIGRVTIEFTIGATGKVPKAEASESTLSDERVGQCMADAVERWEFPRPTDGGTVTARVPFVFAPG